MTRKIVLGLLAFAVSISTTRGQTSGQTNRLTKEMTLPEAIEFVRPSIVQIGLSIPELIGGGILVPGRPRPSGAGFMVNKDGYVVTARHVVEYYRSVQVPNKRLKIGIALPNLDSYKTKDGGTISMSGDCGITDCDIIAEDEEHHVAILKMSNNPFSNHSYPQIIAGEDIQYLHKVATLSPSRPRDGEPVALSGYPLSKTVLVTTSGSVASAWDYETKLVHPPNTPIGFTTPESSDSYLVDMHTNHGNSGGPVYSVKHGEVIGICVSFNFAPVEHGNTNPDPQADPLYFNSGLGNVVPIRYAIDLLKKNNLKWREAGNH